MSQSNGHSSEEVVNHSIKTSDCINDNKETIESNSSEEVMNGLMKSGETNESNDNKDNEVILKSESSLDSMKVLNESKQNKSKYRTVESRYQQSAKQWTNKRNNNSLQNKPKEKSTTTANTNANNSGNSCRPRNPTPNSKQRSNCASTPISSDKSLNCSGVSVITNANDLHETKDNKTEKNPNVKKYSKALTTNRQSVVSRRELYPSLPANEGTVGTSRVPMCLLPVGQDSQTKSKEIEKSINRSYYLQSVFLELKAKQMLNVINSKAFNNMTQIWKTNNQLRLKLQSIQNSVKTLETTIQSIEDLQKQKEFFEKYLNTRKEMDSLYSSFAHLIDNQKCLLKIQNCSESDFQKLNDLLKCLPQLKQIKSFEELSNASLQMEEFNTILSDIESLKSEFIKYATDYERLILIKEQLLMTESIYMNSNVSTQSLKS